MNSLLHVLGTFGQIFQDQLFPRLEEELGDMSEHHRQFVRALALLELDGFAAVRSGRGRPSHDRAKIARAFLAKAVFHICNTRALLDRLAHDTVLRRLCGWEQAAHIPDESVFSRAFAELAHSQFAQRVHAALIERTQKERLVGHIVRDATAIEVREKPGPKAQPAAPAGRRLHRKAGGAKAPEQMTRLERQCSGTMSIAEMLAELPRNCDVGCKLDSRGNKYRWSGYKLHLDVADGQIPISCVLTAASVNDTQVAIPLMLTSAQRVTSLYELMDAGYDCTAIREKSRELGHVPIIPFQKRGSQQIELAPHQKARLRERTAVERVFSRLKDEYGAASVRVRGAAKVMTHLMFGILALTADQILRWSRGHPPERCQVPA
jgi:transposase